MNANQSRKAKLPDELKEELRKLVEEKLFQNTALEKIILELKKKDEKNSK